MPLLLRPKAMKGDYTEVAISIDPPEPGREILIAHLSQLPFDSVLETEEGLKAYIPEKAWKQSYRNALEEIDIPDTRLTLSISRIKAQNWNAAWEAGFEPARGVTPPGSKPGPLPDYGPTPS